MPAGRAFARAALLGNPSDGYGGRTLAFTVADFDAQVTVTAADETSVGSIAPELLLAALERFRERFRGPAEVEMACQTTIPHQVGLGGSSAIVIAAIRALGTELRVTLEADELAAMALAVEAEDLKIAAGPQDRVAQAHQGLVQMDFSEAGAHGVGRNQRLDHRLLPELLIAFRTDGGKSSAVSHEALRARWARGDPAARKAMTEIAALADQGREALLAGDRSRLADLLDRNFALRQGLLDLDPVDSRMAEFAQERGAGANFAGSGGAVVVVPRDPSRIEQLRSDFAAEGFGCVVPEIAAGLSPGT